MGFSSLAGFLVLVGLAVFICQAWGLRRQHQLSWMQLLTLALPCYLALGVVDLALLAHHVYHESEPNRPDEAPSATKRVLRKLGVIGS